MAQWTNIPIDGDLFLNIDEALVSQNPTAVENAFHVEKMGYSRFPATVPFAPLSAERVYLSEWREDLIAVTDKGRMYRVDKTGATEDVTGVPLSGGRRPTFAQTERELLVAAGGPIIKLDDASTSILSPDAPNTTHVAFIDGYVVAIEPMSGRFFHSEAGEYASWDPLDVFTAEGKPDDLTACIVTPYRELLLAGIDSIEQHERLAGGTVPFYRRWATGEGILAPYTLIGFTNGTYGVNKRAEFTRFQAQVSRPEGDEVGLLLQKVDNWTDAWTEVIHIKGQKFILLQAPYATNQYGTEGLTLLLDYRSRKWSLLYGWDSARGIPARWPGWSYHALWGRHFIGVEGGIHELKTDAYSHNGTPQRFLLRTGHIHEWGASRVDDIEVVVKRGVGPQRPAREPELWIRARLDNRNWTRWAKRGLGRPGEREMVLNLGAFGSADVWQFEVMCTDAVPIEIKRLRAYMESLHR